MSNKKSDAGENVRQHVHKVLAQIKALKEQQRTNENQTSPGMDSVVEVERKEDPSSSVGDVEGPS
jgi:hypothetical protein